MTIRETSIINLSEDELPEYITPDEVKRIANEAEKANKKRDWLFIQLLWMTGLRASEAVTLRPMDIEEGGLRIYGKRKPRTEKEIKTNAEPHKKRMRIVQIPPTLRHWLVNFIFDNKLCSEHPIFPFTTTRAYQIILKYSKKAGIQRKIHPHMFRHGFAVHYLNQTHNIQSLQQLLGHTNLKTTSIYLKITSADIQKMVNNVEW